MANPYFSCNLVAWVSGTTIYARMDYSRSGSYFYQDTSFPTPTMNLGGVTYSDESFANTVRNGVYVGSVSSTTFSRTVSSNGTKTIVWSAGSGIRDDFAGSWSTTVTVTGVKTAPTGVSGTTETDGSVKGRAKVSVSVSTWGTNSSAGSYKASKNSSGSSLWGSSSSSPFTFTGLSGSVSTTAGVVNTWYPMATNNNNLSTVGSAMYIASPSAPTITATAGTRATTFGGSITYKGGLTNSTTADTAAMARWQLYLKKTTDSDFPSATANTASTNTSHTFSAVSYSSFATGSNYNVLISAVNAYGAFGETTGTLYMPTGVGGSADTSQPERAVITCSANKKGGWNADNNGSIAGYTITYSKYADMSSATTTSYTTSATTTLTGLSLSTIYYYRVTAYNNYGLSNTSTILNFTTSDYYPPSEVTVSLSAVNGIKADVVVGKTGGLTPTSATISSIKLEAKATSASSWTTLATNTSGSTSVSLQWTNLSQITTAGNHNVRVVVTNSNNATYTYSTTLNAPAKPTVSNIARFNNSPTTISVTGKTTNKGSANILKWRFDTTSPATTGDDLTSTALTVNNLHSAFGLNFATTYTANIKVWNKYGFYNQSSNFTFTTDNRVNWYVVNSAHPTGVKASSRMVIGGTIKDVNTVYWVKESALGNVAVGNNLSSHRLEFITEPLFYSANSVGAIRFSNGKRIAYAQDNGYYKFGIWTSGGALETTFFDGLEWKMTKYDLSSSGWTISAIDKPSRGLNLSPVFSTTRCYPKPLGA